MYGYIEMNVNKIRYTKLLQKKYRTVLCTEVGDTL